MWPSRMSHQNDVVGDRISEEAAGDDRSAGERYTNASWRSTVVYGTVLLVGTAVVLFGILWVAETLVSR